MSKLTSLSDSLVPRSMDDGLHHSLRAGGGGGGGGGGGAAIHNHSDFSDLGMNKNQGTSN